MKAGHINTLSLLQAEQAYQQAHIALLQAEASRYADTAALFQASTASDEPVMLRYHVSGGHSGGEPLKVQVNNSAESLAFLDWQLR